MSLGSGLYGGTKGSLLLARLKWLRMRGGDALVSRVLARLQPPIRQVLEGQILLVTWYPLEVNLRLDEAIGDELSPGDRNRVFLDIGRASADVNLLGPQKPYLKVGDPHFLLANAPTIYKVYYNTGHRTYERTSNTSAVLR